MSFEPLEFGGLFADFVEQRGARDVAPGPVSLRARACGYVDVMRG